MKRLGVISGLSKEETERLRKRAKQQKEAREKEYKKRLDEQCAKTGINIRGSTAYEQEKRLKKMETRNIPNPRITNSIIGNGVIGRRSEILESLKNRLPENEEEEEGVLKEWYGKWYGACKNIKNERPIKYFVYKESMVFMEIPIIGPQKCEYNQSLETSNTMPKEIIPFSDSIHSTILCSGDRNRLGNIIIKSNGKIEITLGVAFEAFEIGDEIGHPYKTHIFYFIDEKDKKDLINEFKKPKIVETPKEELEGSERISSVSPSYLEEIQLDRF